jgi:hypothetical protein
MKIYYVRPARPGGYGDGDGTSYEHAWNGIEAVQWGRLSGDQAATLWVCGGGGGRPGFLTMNVELSYLDQLSESEAEIVTPRTHTRRKSPQPV